MDLLLVVGANAANGPGIGLDGLGLKPLVLQMFEMVLVIALEVCLGC